MEKRIFDAKAEFIAKAVGGDFDYAYGENPVVDIREFAIPLQISENEFNRITDQLSAYLYTAGGFRLSFFFDCSGYTYWHSEDYLPLTITIALDDVDAIRKRSLMAAINNARHFLYSLGCE